MQTIYDLPKPSAIAIDRSNALSDYLRQDITKRGGLISFAAFMETALYHPHFGYYNADNIDLGARGDFTTAPLISPLFAQCFAHQCVELFSLLENNVLELGAGTGHFARDLLLELEKQGALPEQYYIYEISVSLQKKQQAFLKAVIPALFSRIKWLNALPINFAGVVIANEVLDALPVHCFYIDDEIKERSVAYQQDKFVWQQSTPVTEELAQKIRSIREHYQLYNGYQSEINLMLLPFIQSIAQCISQGIILFADYGYGQREYYHPERKNGSLTCFYKHHRFDNPLVWPGLQDITAHVDFTRVIESAIENECTLAGYTTQAAFLLSCGLMGIAEVAAKEISQSDAFNLHQAIKNLTFPTEMGERIKIMALAKNLNKNKPLLGFQLQDRRRDL